MGHIPGYCILNFTRNVQDKNKRPLSDNLNHYLPASTKDIVSTIMLLNDLATAGEVYSTWAPIHKFGFSRVSVLS